jgi:hypothetical protein
LPVVVASSMIDELTLMDAAVGDVGPAVAELQLVVVDGADSAGAMKLTPAATGSFGG